MKPRPGFAATRHKVAGGSLLGTKGLVTVKPRFAYSGVARMARESRQFIEWRSLILMSGECLAG